jgi:hypothetical protein
MKNFFHSLILCSVLSVFGLTILLPKSTAQNNLLQNLIDLPAPPPPNPLVEKTSHRSSNKLKTEQPSDDAPIDDLLNYWQTYGRRNAVIDFVPKPSEKTLDRLMEEFEKDPKSLADYLSIIPSEPKYNEAVKKLFDKESSEKALNSYWSRLVRQWLSRHSDYYLDELVQSAQAIKDTSEYLTNQDDLIALGKINWDLASPIVDRLLNDNTQPISQTLARWVAYQHAVREGNSIDAERFRRALQTTVEDRNQKPGNRDLALDAIGKVGDFNGRDDWYFSLLGDETLLNLRVNGQIYTGLTTLIRTSPPDKYVSKMIELVGSSNQTTQNAAGKNLVTLIGDGNVEVIKALLPWLENPKWLVGSENERSSIIRELSDVAVPESVTGLIAVFNERKLQRDTSLQSPSKSANSANTAALDRDTSEYGQGFADLIAAFEMQKDIRAISPLRSLLTEYESDESQRRDIVRAMQQCGGFSITEQVHALEVVAGDESKSVENANSNASVQTSPRMNVNSPRAANMMRASRQPPLLTDIPLILGGELIRINEASDELVNATIDRIKVLEIKSPKIAGIMRGYLNRWSGKGVNSLLLRDLKSGSVEINSLLKLLIIRKQLRELQSDEVYDIRSGSPIALGVSACIIEENIEYDSILNSENIEAKTAMLGCAKLIRATLPILAVAENLKSSNKMLAIAAERYLESEDSPQARQLVLSLHPNEAKILGAKPLFSFTDKSTASFDVSQLMALFGFIGNDEETEYFNQYSFLSYSPNLRKNAERIQKEVKTNPELNGIYSYNSNYVRIHKDKIVFSWDEDSARYRERELSKAEFASLTNFLSVNRVDELPPFIQNCGYCDEKELIMLSKHGGRRVYVKTERQPKFFEELGKLFEEMRKPPAKLHYQLEKYLPNLEVLFADSVFLARTIWKDGNGLKLLTEEANRRKLIQKELQLEDAADISDEGSIQDNDHYQKFYQRSRTRHWLREKEEFAWYKFENNKLASLTQQPLDVDFLSKKDGTITSDEEQWKARTAKFEIRCDNSGLYRIQNGIATKIKIGIYKHPVVSSDGKWVTATKLIKYRQSLVRVNLLTNTEIPVASPEESESIKAVVYVPASGKTLVLLGNFSIFERSDENEQISGFIEKPFLLDNETGMLQPLKGDMRPLLDQTFRRLQSTGKPNEYWATIVDKNDTEFGRYDSKNLKFTSLIKLPEIKFNSLAMFVDEGDMKVYFVYQGHLLRMPLPKESLK